MESHNLFLVIFVGLFYLCGAEEECINMDEDGTCIERCLEGMTVYQPGCDNATMSQRTCRQPLTKYLGYICDYTRCECSDNKLWDEAAKKCVAAEECSDQSKVAEEEEKFKKEQENFTYTTYTENELIEENNN